MRFQSFISDTEDAGVAVRELIGQARAFSSKIDFATVFVSAHHAEGAAEIAEALWLELDPQALVGCSAEGVIGVDREIERAPGISLLVGETPGVRLHPFHIPVGDWRAFLKDPAALAERVGIGPETRAVIGFGDPFTTPISTLMPTFDAHFKGVPLIGGMASSARQPGENALIRNDNVYTDGLVGVSMSGGVRVDSLVSQGCRPVGRPLVITRAKENVIETLGGKPAMAALQAQVQEMTHEDRELLQNGLLIGRVISEYRENFGRGDFLVRGLTGVSEETGAIAVGDQVRTGQTVQFHVRDAETADEDLAALLAGQGDDAPAAALLFSCNGRGTHLFDKPSHDVLAARRAMPRTPVAGFFAAGELGPVGGRNFIHGHTASFALIRPK